MQSILKSWRGQWPFDRSTSPAETGKGVIDQASFNALEIDQVYDTVNYAQTQVGKGVIYRSLCNPLDNTADINAKQDAIREIQNKPEIRKNLEHIVSYTGQREPRLYLLLFGEFLGSMGTAREDHQIEGYGYKQYRRALHVMKSFVGFILDSAKPESHYLQSIFDRVHQFSQSRTYSLMVGPVYHSEQGFQCKAERKGLWPPAIIFKPQIFKPVLLLSIFLALWFITAVFPLLMFNFSVDAIPVASVFFVPVMLVYFPMVGSYDRDNCIIPLRDIYKECDDLADALDALGELDELLAFIKYAEKSKATTSLPVLEDKDTHSIRLKQTKNPVLAHEQANYVANDFVLDGERLCMITGPNSGGKTALCKTISQIQLLAQVGCFVSAEQAELAVADKIFYQTPEISHLNDGEGRFGTELKRTKDIFVNSTAKSLVVLDEMSEGTTFEEKMESSTNILDGFYRKNGNTVLITHNHQLVDVFVNKQMGMAKQVEFVNEEPSYKLIDGVSRVSHADKVAAKIGFTKEDIEHYLSGEK